MSGPTHEPVVLTPVFNDWECLAPFVSDLSGVKVTQQPLKTVVVNDGSTNLRLNEPLYNSVVEVVNLGTNLGHQRAIAVGLTELAARGLTGPVIVMDADGEDRPAAIEELWEAHLQNPQAIVVAQRRERTEAVRFRLFYRIYRGLFRVLTGRRLDFGNFVLLPPAAVRRLVLMNELWNHFPAAIMRSRLPIVKVPIDRGTRYSGRSRMNFTALVNHGLAAIAAFVDAVFVRLLVLTGVLLGGFAATAAVVVGIRLWGTWGVPGWATTALGLILLALLQLLGLLIVITFLTLSLRSSASPPPATFAREYISKIERIT